jgi:MFS transporter, YNFM family, putative membrane transport protein
MSCAAGMPLPQAAAIEPGPTSVGEEPAFEKQFLLRGTPAFRRASLALFMSGFSTFSLLYCVQPLMPIFATHFKVTAAESSLSLSLSTGFLAVAIFCAAALAESVGRRSLMFASLLGAALCNIVCSVVGDWHMLLAARALEGLLLGGVPAVAMAYLSEEVHRPDSAHRWGFISPAMLSAAWPAVW